MRVVPILMLASALALGACSRNEAVTEDLNSTMENDVLDQASDASNAAAAAQPVSQTISFAAGDGSPLGSVTVDDGPEGAILRLAGTSMPAGIHGIHLHAVGKCEGPKFASAGGHWNPESKQHGTENPNGPHKGDLPNVEVNEEGSLNQILTLTGIKVADLADADGTALVIHAGQDDYKTDPSGNSGDRIACAVIAPAR
ncbi:MAG: superoxide dismutase family protein [Sphingomicrobium sp.]